VGKWKAFIPVVLALVIAFSGSAFLYKWLKTQTVSEKTVTVGQEAVPVVVAGVDLAWGTKLKKEFVSTTLFLKKSLPPGYCSDISFVEGRVLIASLKKNEPIITSKLADESVILGGVSAIIKPDKRAVSVKGDKVIGISGFIQPGNRVDVLATLTDPKTEREMTKVVLENLLVLATGSEIQSSGNGKAAPVDVYTLEVAPEEAEILTLSSTQGRLQFALRNSVDSKEVLTRGATVSKTLSSYTREEPKTGAKKKLVHIVEVIRGTKSDRKELEILNLQKE
jgi:pilus assembly protein CpaB